MMERYGTQTGAALIMVIGITAVLAMLSATLVVAIVNQQGATAGERRVTQSFYAAEAALDTGVQLAKVDRKMSTTEEWLTQEDLEAAFYAFFPAGATVVYRVYDNLATVNPNIKWDQGGPTDANTPDGRVWVEATVTHQGKTTRTRVLITQRQVPFAEALPKAVTYSDTGIRLDGTSNIYAVDEDGNPDTSGPPYQTAITAGGTWQPSNPDPANISAAQWAEVGRFTMNNATSLAAPGTNVQSLGITVNGSVSMSNTVFSGPLDGGSISRSGRTFDSVTIRPGTVGYLSDYFDQKAQSELADESQEGETPAPPPASWTSAGFTTINSTLLNTLQSTTSTTRYDATADLYRNGNLTLSRGTNTTGRVFNFRRLYVSGDLTLTGPVTINCTDLYVNGKLTINNNTTTAVTDDFGAGVYCVGAINVSNNVETRAGFLYGGDNITFAGYRSGVKAHRYSLLYANALTTGSGRNVVEALTTLSGNVELYSSETTLNGGFTISGATTDVKNWVGHLYVKGKASATPQSGKINWSGRASVTSRDWQAQNEPPKPMWMGMYWSRTGVYQDEYGPTWVPGNSGLSVVFDSTGASSMMCPLLCTTERSEWTGNVTYGTRDEPMVYFFMCDNNGIYPQVFKYTGSGTYYGLMVINESTIEIDRGSSSKPSVQGAIFAGCPFDNRITKTLSPSDIVLKGSSCIAYDQHVVGRIATSSLKTTTTITQIVPGSWQQLPSS